MTPEEAKALLIEVISELQVHSCRDLPHLHGESRLRGDVPGCDSVAVVEIGIHLSERLASRLGGCDLPERLLLGTHQHSPTINEIAGDVAKYVSLKENRASKTASRSHLHQAQNGGSASHEIIIDAEPSYNHHSEPANGSIVTNTDPQSQTQEFTTKDYEKEERQK